jgi:hypothetical protein
MAAPPAPARLDRFERALLRDMNEAIGRVVFDDSEQALTRAMNETIARVSGKHTFTSHTQPREGMHVLEGPYSYFMMVPYIPLHQLLVFVGVPSATGALLEGGEITGGLTNWKKVVVGPVELEETVNHFLNILAFAKMVYEQEVKAANQANDQAAQALLLLSSGGL